MSARDSESGSSSYRGGSRSAGGLGNGGIGGGRGGGGNFGGGMGGGAGRIGGIGSRTGLTTGTKMVGTPGRDGLSATGRPGGKAQNPGAWGMRPQSSIARGTLGAPPAAPAVPGLLAEPVPTAAVPAIEDVPMPPSFINNPFVNKPATLPGYVRDVVKSYQNLNAPAAPQPASPSWSSGMWQKNPTSYPQYANSWDKSTWGYTHAPNTAPNTHELSSRKWSGPRVDFNSIQGGYGVQSYNRTNAPGYRGNR